MPISILHIGLPLDHASIPPGDRPALAIRLAALRQSMREAGYLYEILHASPESGLDAFTLALATLPCDAVVLGGGVTANPDLAQFKQQLVDTIGQHAPHARILLYDHSIDLRTFVERSLAQPSASTSPVRLPR